MHSRLRRHTRYGGGYSETSAAVKHFWQVGPAGSQPLLLLLPTSSVLGAMHLT